MSSRIAHHIDFPDYSADELLAIAELMLAGLQYRLSDQATRRPSRTTSRGGIAQPHFANARSIRNALDRARLRQANRLFDASAPVERRGADDDRGGRSSEEPGVRGRGTGATPKTMTTKPTGR